MTNLTSDRSAGVEVGIHISDGSTCRTVFPFYIPTVKRERRETVTCSLTWYSNYGGDP